MDIQLKRGQEENFTSVELLPGEPAFLLDTGELYIGNGSEKVLINPPLPDVSNFATKNEVDNAVNSLDEEIKGRGYLTEITNIDGGEF